MQRIYIASPCKGATEQEFRENMQRAIRACHAVSNLGFLPCAPHVFYSPWLDDANPYERARGMELAREELLRSDRILVFQFPRWEASEGVKEERRVSKVAGIPENLVQGSGDTIEGIQAAIVESLNATGDLFAGLPVLKEIDGLPLPDGMGQPPLFTTN